MLHTLQYLTRIFSIRLVGGLLADRLDFWPLGRWILRENAIAFTLQISF